MFISLMYVFLYNTIKWPYQPKHSPSINDGKNLVTKYSISPNFCQLIKRVRQACRSWYRFLDITSFMLDPFSLSWLSMLLAMLF